MGRGGFSWHKQTHSSMMEKHLNNFLSDLPPIHFSLQPGDLAKDGTYPKIHCNGGGAVAKSWLPAHTRCARAHRRPLQLRHAITAPPESPAPHPHNHFLADPTSTALEAALQMHGASHWCLLEHSGSRPAPSGPADPKMKLSHVSLGPNSPSSGLVVSYSLMKESWWYRHVSVTYECAAPDPFDTKGKPMEFTGVARCGGKFYAVTMQGAVAAMEVFDTRLAITAVGSARAVPRSRSSRFFKEYFFEMEGEMLLVYLIHHESLEVVDDVEVFRLDLDRLDWIKVERIRGKTVFLKESRVEWVESAEFGCRDNCVFFTEGKENKWRVYDFKTCCISFVL